MPKVSVIIPSRNRPGVARRAVQSALAQTCQDLEVIVVVDGPDPKTLSMLQQIADRRLKVIALEDSVGGSEARNIGALRAKGEWVALLDDDDEWLPTKIEKQLLAAESSKASLVLVVCSFFLKAGKDETLVPRRFPRPSEHISEYLFGAPRNGFQTSGFFCSRELMLQEPWHRLKGLQDIDWFLRVTTRTDVQLEIVRDPLCIYWTEGESTITSKLDWQTCLDWGQSHRSLMTPRAYSSFIAKVCAHRAAKQRAGASTMLRLLRELLFSGTPTASSLLLFAVYVTASYERRRSLANALNNFTQKVNALKRRFSYSRA
jgi:glycosyltransferase involved in cell wall biosynthesis